MPLQHICEVEFRMRQFRRVGIVSLLFSISLAVAQGQQPAKPKARPSQSKQQPPQPTTQQPQPKVQPGHERARDLGVPFDGTPGPLNAITDVAGIEVGTTTLIRGDGPLKVGTGPIRTGVTVIMPRGKAGKDPVYAGWFSLNGNGEMTGTSWVEESGFLEGPLAITNTHSVG